MLNEVRELKPYGLGLLGRGDVGAEPFSRWAQKEILGPFLRALDQPSSLRVRDAIKAQIESDGTCGGDGCEFSPRLEARGSPLPPLITSKRLVKPCSPA